MAVTDSAPNFLARCNALGLSEIVQNSLTAAGLDAISKLAFSSSYVPGQQDEQPFSQAMALALGRAPNVGEMASLRRLLHESYSMTAAELKQSVERTDDQSLKELAQPERADRLSKQQDRLKGIRTRGNYEPADMLVDLCVNLYEENRLAYIEPSACISKAQEVVSKSKEDRHISVVDGNLRIKNTPGKIEAELGTDLLLRYALTRRGLALDQANLVDYELYEAWVERLMEIRHTAPPANYAAATHQQLLNADRKLFVKLAELTRSGVQLEAAGEGPWTIVGTRPPSIQTLPTCCNPCLPQQSVLNLIMIGFIHTRKTPKIGIRVSQRARVSIAFRVP